MEENGQRICLILQTKKRGIKVNSEFLSVLIFKRIKRKGRLGRKNDGDQIFSQINVLSIVIGLQKTGLACGGIKAHNNPVQSFEY